MSALERPVTVLRVSKSRDAPRNAPGVFDRRRPGDLIAEAQACWNTVCAGEPLLTSGLVAGCAFEGIVKASRDGMTIELTEISGCALG